MWYTNKIIVWVGQQDRPFSFLHKKNIISRAPHTTQKLCDSKKGVINPKDTVHIAFYWFRVLQPMVTRAFWPMTVSVILKQNYLNLWRSWNKVLKRDGSTHFNFGSLAWLGLVNSQLKKNAPSSISKTQWKHPKMRSMATAIFDPQSWQLRLTSNVCDSSLVLSELPREAAWWGVRGCTHNRSFDKRLHRRLSRATTQYRAFFEETFIKWLVWLGNGWKNEEWGICA